MSWTHTLIDIVRATPVERLSEYWTTYTGRLFDVIAAQTPSNELTAADLYACTLLSTPIDPQAGARLLDQDARRCSDLLEAIPDDVTIRDSDASDILGADPPATELYDHLRSMRGIGYTRASKLLAVKRPALVPIRDSFVEKALGAQSSKTWWQPMVRAWADPSLGEAIDELRKRAGEAVPGHVTDLRLLDVAVWLSVEGAGAV